VKQLSLLTLLVLVGCGNSDMSKAEMDRAANAKFDDAARAKIVEGMREGAEARQKQQSDWGNKNPEELARINAERAKYGRAPLAGN
jgi:hypothetical protein